MDAPFFNPLMPTGVPTAQLAGKVANLDGDKDFATFMNQRLTAEAGRKDLFGVRDSGSNEAATSSEGTEEPGKKTTSHQQGGQPGIMALLQEFMQKLQALSTDTKNGPGEWDLSPADADLLKKLGTDLGMSGSDLTELLNRLKQDQKLPLGQLFGALSRQFGQLAQPAAVTVPETDLPLLASILGRQGVSTDQLQKIADDSTAAGGMMDLEKFLEALENLPQNKSGQSPVQLDQGETEQLQAMLASAGATRQQQFSLLPELGLSWGKDPQPQKSVQMSLGRLESMLRETIGQVAANRPQADLPAFFADLNQVLTQSGFVKKGTSWSPAVENSAKSMYDQLLASVDLAGAKVEGPPLKSKIVQQIAQTDSAPQTAQDASDSAQQDGKGSLFAMKGEQADALSSFQAAVLKAAKASAEGKKEGKQHLGRLVDNTGKGPTPGTPPNADAAQSLAVTAGKGGAASQPAAASTPAPAPPPVPEVWQQTMAQLTSGVGQALSDNEHHFVLRLQPPDLGEVKVEVLVRNDQISLAFTMDNRQVKEMLQNNMNHFQDNLQRQGFVVGECRVSVGDQRQNSDEAWQRFVAAWKEQKGRGRLVEGIGGANPQDLLSRALGRPGRENGLNIII